MVNWGLDVIFEKLQPPETINPYCNLKERRKSPNSTTQNEVLDKYLGLTKITLFWEVSLHFDLLGKCDYKRCHLIREYSALFHALKRLSLVSSRY